MGNQSIRVLTMTVAPSAAETMNWHSACSGSSPRGRGTTLPGTSLPGKKAPATVPLCSLTTTIRDRSYSEQFALLTPRRTGKQHPDLGSALRTGYRSLCDSLDGLARTTDFKSIRKGEVMAFMQDAHPQM